MRSFLAAVLVSILFAIGFAVGLKFVQESADDAFKAESVRL